MTSQAPGDSGPGSSTDGAGGRAAVDGMHSMGSLIGDVASDFTRLLRQEVALARAEIRREGTNAVKAGRLLAGAATALHLVAVLATIAVALAASRIVADVVPQWAPFAPAMTVAALALLWLVIGLVLVTGGRRRLRSVSPVPRQTIKTIKEDIAWLRRSIG